ncbi:hypothetical protein CHL67_09125 [Prosthecochloris sp. GSB1]|uniref:damage-control phosphatase ARMT1 family protein n=1 Tax=Prosthecochloris sp. GSB1 TaxID=281093 RepID=UPI000B8CFB71|nr:ARMT1-like domain-containing protein [Prosthecochloris sp. GSB1]ASQ91057.1 hypothetical protein CHL67_09125 [Prosthecochloris sp. GSB1]
MSKRGYIPLDCYPCLFEQVSSLAKITGIGGEKGKELFEHAMRRLLDTRGKGIVVQHVVRSATDKAIALSGRGDGYDPYGDIKRQSNDAAMRFAGAFDKKLRESPDPLQYGVKIAAAGNIIDFGAKKHGSLDVEKELRTLDDREFGRFDFAAFADRLRAASSLLYICDNAGEIVFDKLFIEAMQRYNPAVEITCAVREAPVINDVVFADAHAVGLDEVAAVISSGSIYPGTLLDETSDEFRRLYERADLIVSKGQGNLETLLDEADERLFFILRIKCDQMARLSGVEKGALVLMQGGERG